EPISTEWTRNANLIEDYFDNPDTSLGKKIYGFDNPSESSMQDNIFTGTGENQRNAAASSFDHFGSIVNIPIEQQIAEPIWSKRPVTIYPDGWLATPVTFTDIPIDRMGMPDFQNSLTSFFAGQY